MIASHLRVDPGSPIPLVAQLTSQLTWLIVRGEAAVGTNLPPIRTMASDLGINLNTVRASYKQLEGAGLVVTQRGRGTTVLGYDRGQHLGKNSDVRSFTVGVILPAHSLFYVPFLNAVEAASNDPSLVFICVAQESPLRGLAYLDQLVAKNVDGVLVAGPMLPKDVELPERPPIVFADYPGMAGPGIVFDHEGGAATATAHLIEHGHYRLGLLTPERGLPNVEPKHVGFESAIEQAGVEGIIEVTAGFLPEHGARGARALLTAKNPPTAIVAASDTIALGVMETARALGMQIPRDVALIGSDNTLIAGALDPPLTSVNVPTEQMGALAARMLTQLIAEPASTPVPIALETDLIIRRSCGCHDPDRR